MPIGPSGVAGFFARARGSSRRSLVCSLRQLSRMCTQNQDEVVRFLESSSTHAGAAVERIETHGSVVFLAGARAWKLKRAVRYDYMDFSTLNRRKAMCEAEVRINRRAAPAIYRGVVPVTRERGGELALGGAGVPVEWLVEMVRFDQDTLLDRLAARRRLDLRLMRPLASAVAAFHRDAPRRHDHGGAHGMAWVIDGNVAAFREQGAGILDQAACEALTRDARQALTCHRAQLDARRDAGFVRQCHGDLHLRNIVMLDGRPTLFDAIEFNDEIACIDVLYDLAFLLMDLWRRQLPQHANALWNAYLDRTGDLDGLSLVPLFLSCRAAVRASRSRSGCCIQRRLVSWRSADCPDLERPRWHIGLRTVSAPHQARSSSAVMKSESGCVVSSRCSVSGPKVTQTTSRVACTRPSRIERRRSLDRDMRRSPMPSSPVPPIATRSSERRRPRMFRSSASGSTLLPNN
jgi:aminoglycoside phosphotransferase family enzyme